jgi:hypothetical protein
MLEGTIQGEQRCAQNRFDYTFDGHFLGEGVIVYDVSVKDEHGHVAGYVRGQVRCSPLDSRSDVWRTVGNVVRQAVRGGDFLA